VLSDLQHTLLPFLQHSSGYAGWVAFFAAFLETLIGAGYFLPGSTILLLMGVFAGQGFIDIRIVFVFAFLGAFVGDQENYFLGRKYGLTLLDRPWLHISDKIIKKAEYFLDSYGSVSVFFGRFLPGVKESISFIAGTLKMNYGKFLFWETLGAIGWSLEFVGVGYLFSSSLSLARLWLERTTYILLVLALFFIFIYLLVYFIKKNASDVSAVLKSLKESILSNQKIKNWITNHPKSVRFTINRTIKSDFFGLPFTLLLISFLYILALFAGSVEDFVSKDSIVITDHIIANIIPALRTLGLNSFFTYITLLGKTEVAVAFLLCTFVILWAGGKKLYMLPLLISVSGAGIFMYLSKLAFHRPRPDIALYFEPTYSFPSGHATMSVAIYGFVGYLLMHFSKEFKTKINIFFITTILVLLIGISRIYLGEHYLSDVYSGYLLGSIWFVIAVAFTRWLEEKTKDKKIVKKRFFKIITASSFALFIIFFAVFSQTFHYSKNHIAKEKSSIINSIASVIKTKNRLTQSLVGLDSWPVNLIFIDDSLKSLKKTLEKAKWSDKDKNLRNILPIYWNYKKANLFMTNKSNKKTYLLKIWKTNKLTEKNRQIFVATAVAIDGYDWKIIPKYKIDIDNARLHVNNLLKKSTISSKSKTIQLSKAFVGNDILGNQYLTDGKCDIIYLKKGKN